MKHMKKFMALFAALALVMAMAVPAFAAQNDNSGTIAINNAVEGETYTIYQMFTLDSYDGTNYSYTVVPKWESFFEAGNPGASYITLTNGHPKWVAADEDRDTTVAEFAKAALAWAQDSTHGITETTHKDATTTTVEFTGLNLGYYLVDTTVGSLCDLTTTAPNSTIQDKNEVPEIEKKIIENNTPTDSNSAKIGDTVNYEVTVKVKKGTTDYVVRDTMDDGLTFSGTVTVSVDNSTVAEDENATYKLVYPTTDSYTFTLQFANSFIESNVGKNIKINYSATINEKARIADVGNKNKVKLKYGNGAETTEHDVTTYVYKFDLVKTDGNTNKLLSDAEFKLYDAETDGNEIKLVKNADGSYRVATADEQSSAVEHIVTTSTGVVKISGLKKTTYWLEETKAPEGYNKIVGRAEVDLTGGSKNVNADATGNTWTESDGGVLVKNYAGTTLPGTGGIGTTIFYVVGGGLMVAAAVLLVAKKRMENK